MRKLYVELIPDTNAGDNIEEGVHTKEYFDYFEQGKRITIVTSDAGYVEVRDNPHLAHLVKIDVTEFDRRGWLFMPYQYKIILEKPMES